MSIHVYVMRRLLIITLAASFAAATRPWHDAIAAPPPESPRVLAEFSITEGDPLWVVRTTVRGKEYQMVIDTGSSATIIDVAHRELLGKVIATGNVNGAGGLTPIRGVQMFRMSDIELGMLTLKPWGALCIDLSGLSKACRTKIDGVLGMDLLRRQVFTFDPDERTLRFYNTAGAQPGQCIPVEWSNESKLYGEPMVDVLLADGKTRSFLVDTGVNHDLLDGTHSGSVRKDTYDQLLACGALIEAPMVNAATAYTASGETSSSQFARATEVQVGSFRQHGLIFSTGRGPNCLGLGYFARFHATFDFPNDRIYLRPAKEFSRSDFLDLSGIRIAKKGKEVRVSWLLRGGPGERAGILVGDVILAIDGADADHRNMLDIRARLSKSGRCMIDLRRGDAEKSVALVFGAQQPK